MLSVDQGHDPIFEVREIIPLEEDLEVLSIDKDLFTTCEEYELALK
jgi:hypothetical protein